MKKILIIGAKGMLGQELVQIFKKDNGYKVVAWDREDIDITREKEVSKKISIIKPAVIINAAAYNAVDKCEEDKKEFDMAKKVNGLAPGYLAAAAKKNKAVLVHYSTDHVFSGSPRFDEMSHRVEAGEPELPEPQGCTHSCASCSLHENFKPEIGFSEENKPKPVNKYGKTKLLGEQNIQKEVKNFYIIRLAALFGKPAVSKDAKRGFFDFILEKGKKGEVRKVVDEETTRLTYAPDLARKTKEIIDAKKPFGIYHVTNNGCCSWYEAAVELYKQAKIKTEIIPVTRSEFPTSAKRPLYSVLLNTKLNPMRDWKDALKEYLKGIK
jgi:dTDP-4-dehydrorhamnose reductase